MTPNMMVAERPEGIRVTTMRLRGARQSLTFRMEDFGMDCSDETSVRSTKDSSETDSRLPSTNPFLWGTHDSSSV